MKYYSLDMLLLMNMLFCFQFMNAIEESKHAVYNFGNKLMEQFGNERMNILTDAVKHNKFSVVKNLVEMNVFCVNDILDSAIKEGNSDLIAYLYTNKFLNNEPSLMTQNRQVTPLDYFMSSDLKEVKSAEAITITMIKHGANINQLIGTEQVSPLYKAMMLKNENLFNILLSHGADPSQKNKDGNSVMRFIQDNNDQLKTFATALNNRGLHNALKQNAGRGRKFTVQRKKVQHRWGMGMMVSNTSSDNQNNAQVH